MTDKTPAQDPREAARLPCPFCGGECGKPQNYGDSRDGRHRFVECLTCFANFYRFRDTQAEADTSLYEAWNRRADTAIEAERDKLKSDLANFGIATEHEAESMASKRIAEHREYEARIAELKADRDRMREALEPFARMASDIHEAAPDNALCVVATLNGGIMSNKEFCTVSDLRRARDLMEKTNA